ncbi:alpha/beta fold hydrolase [Streptomyces eurocidicus]|uniref:Triacylglycerol esterase/lipase EstA (Alpha/beta hydrolase family) n=1 Tax=Streptomyces eurocidicus TaxID=66423 RepID=A0A7W8BE82_STREU|nr:alpha/beta fold hydrolase [Streptomyces eurocidicus]MBB5121227.1 triacylglycerol esterase/lipase EstA (alpha/beta hydrolase family) [Streptomyces eurocidicus]
MATAAAAPLIAAPAHAAPDPRPTPSAAPAASTGYRPVIFVHGLKGDALTWGSMVDNFRNSQADRPGYSGSELHTWGYDWKLSNKENARKLHEYISEKFPRTKVDIVAHSMGSLVSRWYLKDPEGHGWKGAEKVANWVSIGGPNKGTTLAALCNVPPDEALAYGAGGLAAACDTISGGLPEMTVGSDFLKALNSGDPTPGNVRYTTIGSPADGLVFPRDSVALDGADNHNSNNIAKHKDLGHSALLDDSDVAEFVAKRLQEGQHAERKPHKGPFKLTVKDARIHVNDAGNEAEVFGHITLRDRNGNSKSIWDRENASGQISEIPSEQWHSLGTGGERKGFFLQSTGAVDIKVKIQEDDHTATNVVAAGIAGWDPLSSGPGDFSDTFQGTDGGVVRIDYTVEPLSRNSDVIPVDSEKDCPKDYLCVYRGKWRDGGGIAVRSGVSVSRLADHGFNDAMQSWINRSGRPYSWYEDTEYGGGRHPIGSHEAVNMTSHSNLDGLRGKASSLQPR